MKNKKSEESQKIKISGKSNYSGLLVSLFLMIFGIVFVVINPHQIFEGILYTLFQPKPHVLYFIQNYLSTISGILIFSTGIILLAYSRRMNATNAYIAQNYYKILALIFVATLLCATLYGTFRSFDHDEFEHIHSAWYISNGFVPYKDFYEHHHPLFWYILQPFFLIAGETTQMLFLASCMQLIIFSACIIFTYKTAKLLDFSKEKIAFLLILLLTNIIFISKGTEIRPDGLQCLFCCGAIYFALKFLKKGEQKQLHNSSFLWSLALVTLQKAIFLFIPFLAALSLQKIQKSKLTKKFTQINLTKAAILFFIPLLIFGAILNIQGALNDYILTNWLVNLYFLSSFSAIVQIRFFIVNWFFWVAGIIAIITGCLDKRSEIRLMSLTSLLFFPTFLVTKTPFLQYLVPIIPLVSLILADKTINAFEKLHLNKFTRLLIFGLICLAPIIFILGSIPNNLAERTHQLERIDFALKNSASSDYIYDKDIEFNLFRKDIHYFWFSTGKSSGLGTYNALTNNKYGDYAVCNLLAEKKPKIASTITISDCNLNNNYTQHSEFQLSLLNK